MMIYINTDFKCHTVAGDGMTAVETTAFDGKCAAYIEGYRFIPAGHSWTGEDGTVYLGEAAFPVTDWEALDKLQRAYERAQYEALTTQNAEYEAALSEIEAALGVK